MLILIVLGLLVNNCIANSDEDYVDSVINMLLNGDSLEFVLSEENGKEAEPILTGGIWKCGNCAGVDDSMLVYSEVNDIDADVIEHQPLNVEIELSIPSMQCVSVVGAAPGAVRRAGGACAGPHVALRVAASSRFTVRVYASNAT